MQTELDSAKEHMIQHILEILLKVVLNRTIYEISPNLYCWATLTWFIRINLYWLHLTIDLNQSRRDLEIDIIDVHAKYEISPSWIMEILSFQLFSHPHTLTHVCTYTPSWVHISSKPIKRVHKIGDTLISKSNKRCVKVLTSRYN